MDENTPIAEEGVRDKKEKKKRSPAVRAVLAAVLTLILVGAAVLIFLYRDRLTGEGLRESLGLSSHIGSESAAFTYENGSDLTFAPMGDGFAVASASGVQLLDSAGQTVAKEVCSVAVPAVWANKSMALFCDIGGSTCKAVFTDGRCVDIEAGNSIISASVSSGGCFAVISEESGSKGLVRVFNSECTLLYEWFSGTGYPLSAQVSPDNRLLSVLCLANTGTVLHFFRLNSEDELASFSVDGRLFFDLRFMADDRVCIVSEDGLLFVDSSGTQKGAYDFSGRYMGAYCFSSGGFAAVCLSEYRTGTGGTVITLDSDGEVLGSADSENDILFLSAAGKQVLAATGDSISLYSQTMAPVKSAETLVTARRMFLRERGDVLLLSSYSAEIFDF